MLRDMPGRLQIAGGGGVRLNVVEAGNAKGPPILFIHGYCQSTYAWRFQLASDLARDFRLVAFDLRGHGDSEKPSEPDAYTNSKLWADDVEAVLGALDLERVVLAGWSYAGYVVCDYVRFHGSQRLRAINFVSAVTVKGPYSGPRFAELFPAIFSSEKDVTEPVFATFADLCYAKPLDPTTRDAMIEASRRTNATGRQAMLRGRQIDNDDVLARLRLPVLCTHGTDDAVVLPAASEHTASVVPGARLSIYEGVGHAPFAEDPERFNRELRQLAGSLH